MIPKTVKDHLDRNYPGYEHHRHSAAITAQELAEAQHVSGYRVAKSVVVKLGGELALAVIAATDRLNLARLEEATATTAELASEAEFVSRFVPCEPGAEPPLSIFGLQIFADDKFLREPTLLMAAGTHEDSIALETSQWIAGEHVQPVANLGDHQRGARVSGPLGERRTAVPRFRRSESARVRTTP